MVMRNRNDGGGAPQGWDDLPPRVRARFSHPPEAEETTDDTSTEPQPLLTGRELFGDLTRLALLFAVIAVANMLFLLLALSFLAR